MPSSPEISREQAIIDTISGVLAADARALANDAYHDPASNLIYTTDMLVEDQHFKRSYFSAYDIGWKAAAVNVSDIAGMGGKLKYLLVSVGLPEGVTLAYIEEMYHGLNACARLHGGAIIGGDTVAAHQIILNVTAVGELPPGHHIGRRDGAKPGDFIITTGLHGLSAVGINVLKHGEDRYGASRGAHLQPQPRIEAGLMLSKTFERYALMDSSDGLADALLKIATASNVRLVAERDRIPMSPEIAEWCRTHHKLPWDYVLYGGEDFELIAAVPEVPEGFEHTFTVIGRVEEPDAEGPGAWVRDENGLERLEAKKTYQHFGG